MSSATITLDTPNDTTFRKVRRLRAEGKRVPLPLLLLMLGDAPACAHLAPGSEDGTLTWAAPNLVRCAACMESLDLDAKWTCDGCWQEANVLWDVVVPAPRFTMTFHLCLRCTCREVELAAPEVGPNDHLSPTELLDVKFLSMKDLVRSEPARVARDADRRRAGDTP